MFCATFFTGRECICMLLNVIGKLSSNWLDDEADISGWHSLYTQYNLTSMIAKEIWWSAMKVSFSWGHGLLLSWGAERLGRCHGGGQGQPPARWCQSHVSRFPWRNQFLFFIFLKRLNLDTAYVFSYTQIQLLNHSPIYPNWSFHMCRTKKICHQL